MDKLKSIMSSAVKMSNRESENSSIKSRYSYAASYIATTTILYIANRSRWKVLWLDGSLVWQSLLHSLFHWKKVSQLPIKNHETFPP